MSQNGKRFVGKRALVTGGSKGIGRGIVDALVAEGTAEVINLDLIKEDIPGVKTIQVDLSDWDATRACLEDIGPIHLLVNNAGIGHNAVNFVDIDKNVLEKVLAVNLKSHFNVGQIIAQNMIQNSIEGSIVNVASLSAVKVIPTMSPYSISKAGVQMMTKCMALELGPNKIRVNSVNPTMVTGTDLTRKHWSDESAVAFYRNRTPLGRFAEVSDVVKTVLFLLSDDAQMITGSAINIDGGLLSSL